MMQVILINQLLMDFVFKKTDLERILLSKRPKIFHLLKRLKIKQKLNLLLSVTGYLPLNFEN